MMARQPFSLPTYKDTPALDGAGSSSSDFQNLRSWQGRIAINWSGVELHLSLTLGSLLGVDNAGAVAVFNSPGIIAQQRDALRAAAEKTLTSDAKQVFDAILAVHEELDKQRNDVIHCVWGRGDAPGAFCVCSNPRFL